MYQFYAESLLGNRIFIHPSAREKEIYDILLERFESEEHMSLSFESLHDPYLLKDMDKAVARIKIALEKKETVVVFGDYDVDGVTSTSLLVHLFTKL